MIKQLASIPRYAFNLQANNHKAIGLSKFQHKAKFPVLELVEVPNLTSEDIANFDQFYNTQTVSEFRDFKGKRVLIKKIYEPNIGQILQFKIGENFEYLIQFLEKRGDFITDIELAYCLITIKKHHRHYLLPLAKTYLLKIDQLITIGKLKFYSIETMRDIIEVHNCSNFLDEPSIIICINFLMTYTQHLERKIELREEVDESDPQQELSQVYLTLLELCNVMHKKNHAFESLMKVRKVLTRKLNLLPIQNIVGLLHLSTKYQKILFTEVAAVQKMEDFLLQHYNVLDMVEKVRILQSMASFSLKHSAFAERLLLEIRKNNESILVSEFSILLVAFSQFSFQPDVQANFWEFVENRFLMYKDVEPLIFSNIIQVFGQNQQGSLEFWKQIQISNLDQNNYADNFTLLQNLLRLGCVDINLIENITQQELRGKEFKYLNKYALEQRLSVFQTFIQAYHCLPNLNDQHESAFNLLLNQMKQLLFNNDNDRDDIYKNVYLRLKYVLLLNMALDITKRNEFEKQKHNIAQELLFAQRKLDRLIDKRKLTTYESMFLYAILSSRQDKNARLLDLLAEQIQDKLQQITNFEEILKIIHLGYQIKLVQPRFWLSVLKKVHSTVEAFNVNDLVILRNILQIHLKDSDEFSYLKLSIIQICNRLDVPLYLIRDDNVPLKQCQNLDDLLRMLMVCI